MALLNVKTGSVDIQKKGDYDMGMYYPDDIKALRLRLGLTPTQFAAKLNVSASTICLWEKGDRRPRFDAMVALNNLAATTGRKRELAGVK